MSVAAPTTTITTTTMTATMTTVRRRRRRRAGERAASVVMTSISIVILGLRENVVALPLGHVAEALVTVPPPTLALPPVRLHCAALRVDALHLLRPSPTWGLSGEGAT